jgi:MFS family permease
MPTRRHVVSPSDSPLAVALVFSANGFALAALLSRIPDIRDQIGASPTQLAFVLVCLGIGSLVGMPFTDRLIDRYSSRWVNRIAAGVRMAGYIILPMIRPLPVLALLFFITGIGMGAGAVAMNVQGYLVETRRSQVWMPFWHALFSFGAAVGALAGALAASLHFPLIWQMLIVSVIVQIVIWKATTNFVLDSGLHLGQIAVAVEEPIFDEPQAFAEARLSITHYRQPAITLTELALAVIALVTSVGEGTANNWLAVMLVDNRGVPASIGALTFAGFNATMALGRFTGGVLIRRFGRTLVLRFAGAFAGAGLALLCLIYSVPGALLGSLALGLGLSIGFPATMSALGEAPGRGPRAIAVVSAIAVGGSLIAAPSIGFLTGLMPLDRALLIVAGLLVLIAIFAPFAREQRLARPQTGSQVVGERSSG